MATTFRGPIQRHDEFTVAVVKAVIENVIDAGASSISYP